jgi:hypothetical protein
LIFYGGLKKFRGSIKVGEVFLGFFCYNTVTGEWKKPHRANNNQLVLRRNHLAFVVNTDFIIHGGQDENSNMIETVNYLCLKSYEWRGVVDTVDQKTKLPAVFKKRKRWNKDEDKNSIAYKIENLQSNPLITARSPGKVTHHGG